MRICMYEQVYTYEYGCKLAIDMYARLCIYAYVQIGSRHICVGGCMYFMREPLIQPCEYK